MTDAVLEVLSFFFILATVCVTAAYLGNRERRYNRKPKTITSYDIAQLMSRKAKRS